MWHFQTTVQIPVLKDTQMLGLIDSTNSTVLSQEPYRGTSKAGDDKLIQPITTAPDWH